MTDADRQHTTEAAEGDVPGDDEAGGRTPHPEDPAEGPDAAGVDVPTPPVTPGEM
jgi:hypothetical protein